MSMKGLILKATISLLALISGLYVRSFDVIWGSILIAIGLLIGFWALLE